MRPDGYDPDPAYSGDKPSMADVADDPDADVAMFELILREVEALNSRIDDLVGLITSRYECPGCRLVVRGSHYPGCPTLFP